MKTTIRFVRLTQMLVLAVAVSQCKEGGSGDSESSGGGADGTSASDGQAGQTTAAHGGAGPSGEAGSESTTRPNAQCSGEVKSFGPDDKNLQYSGRIDWTDQTRPKFSAAGVTIRASFVGESLSVLIDDQHRYNYRNYFDVIVDEQEPYKLAPEKGKTTYEIPIELDCSEHVVTVVKRTEANIGYAEFLGLKVEKLLEPPVQPKHKIEVIGDSITCGAGVEALDKSPECSEDSWGQPYHNVNKAYGSVVARAVDAEVYTTCVSGIGLVQNYNFDPDSPDDPDKDLRTMPEVYDLLYLEQTDSPAWDTELYVPDAILIGLGTNDFSPGEGYESNSANARLPLDKQVFIDAYIDFIDTLKGYYPGVHVFILGSPMLGDDWPSDAPYTYTSKSDQREALTAVEEHFADDSKVMVTKYFPIALSGKGCGSHPTAEQQEYTGNQIAKVVQAEMGW